MTALNSDIFNGRRPDDNQVRTIYCDRSGNIWIGFNGNRKQRVDRMMVHHSKATMWKTDSAINAYVQYLEDREGTIWLGTGLGNVCVFDGQQFSEFNYEGKTFQMYCSLLAIRKITSGLVADMVYGSMMGRS